MFKMRTVLLGGLAVAAAATALKNRDKVAGLIGARSSAPEPSRPEPGPVATPTPSNYDAPGPVANTATPVPAPEPVVRGEGGIDEKAEEEAAAAEAAAIGGATPAYAGTEFGETADESERPLAEAGEGESEGQEQTEALLADNAEAAAGDTIAAERQVDDVIEQAGQPSAGEQLEPLVSETREGEGEDKEPAPDEDSTSAGPGEGDSSATHPSPGTPDQAEGGDEETGASIADQPTVEISTGSAPGLPDTGAAEVAEEEAGRERPASEKSVWSPPTEGGNGKDDDNEWQTWSGRAVRPSD